MSRHRNTVFLLSVAALGALPSVANATDYYALNAPTSAAQEINASMGGLNARSLIAAGRMGLMFYKTKSITEAALLSECQKYTPLGTTWKEQCDFGGLTKAMSLLFSQAWLTITETNETTAIQSIITGPKNHGSPSIVPLYGHATHWATIYMVSVTGSTLEGAEWFNSGPAGQKDGQFTFYQDGFQGSDGLTFQNTYYDILNSPYLNASDPYLHKYLVTYDPPLRVSVEDESRRVASMGPIQFARSPALIGEDERMTAELAQEHVWDVLFEAGISRSRTIWPIIEQGVAAPAIRVEALTVRGEPWDYFLVPIMGDEGVALGMVQLSADDGAFQQVWAAREPSPFYGVTHAEAQAIAERTLGEGEQLFGGHLTWDPYIEEPRAASPLFPYYEYHVLAADGVYRGRLLVMLRDGDVSFHAAAQVSTCAAAR